jgi:hypothetical protein
MIRKLEEPAACRFGNSLSALRRRKQFVRGGSETSRLMRTEPIAFGNK